MILKSQIIGSDKACFCQLPIRNSGDLFFLVWPRYNLTGWALTWPSSVGGKQHGPTMATFLVLFLLALALTPSSGGGSSATGVTSGCFPNMNFKVFSHQGTIQHKDAPDHLPIKSLWTTTKVMFIQFKCFVRNSLLTYYVSEMYRFKDNPHIVICNFHTLSTANEPFKWTLQLNSFSGKQ